MRKLLLLVPFLLIGCGEKTQEEQDAAKFAPPKMMSDAEGQKFMQEHKDPRHGGPIPSEPPKAGT